MNRLNKSILGFGAGAFLAVSANATPLGFNEPTEFWDRGDAGTSYAFFDTFTAASGADISDPEESNGFTTPELGQSLPVAPPGGVTGGGDRIYPHFSATSYSLTGDVGYDAKTVIVQIKQPFTSSYSFSPALLNGISADFSATTSIVEDTGASGGGPEASITTFGWYDSLVSESISSLSVSFAGGPFAFLDGVQIDVSDTYYEVPEPAGLTLLAGMAAMTLRRRRGA